MPDTGYQIPDPPTRPILDARCWMLDPPSGFARGYAGTSPPFHHQDTKGTKESLGFLKVIGVELN